MTFKDLNRMYLQLPAELALDLYARLIEGRTDSETRQLLRFAMAQAGIGLQRA